MPRPDPIIPGPGQESVQDYPIPPRVDPVDSHIRIECNGIVIAESSRAIRVLEHGHPPAYYLPPEDIRVELIVPETNLTACEWKGTAHHYGLDVGGERRPSVAWCYPEPLPGYESIAYYVAFAPIEGLRCTVDGALVQTTTGIADGGWITPSIAGPFAQEPSSDFRTPLVFAAP